MKDFKSYCLVLLITVILAGIDFLLLKRLLPNFNTNTLYHSIPTLFAFFGLSSLLVLFVQNKVYKKNPEQIGYVFLLLSSLKTVVAYVLVHPVLQDTNSVAKLEKINFFSVFVVFLSIDVVLTSRLLKNVGKKN